jgi:8-oxo-dGTP pyrophosphatase MutT (NUDIX family)
LVVRGPGGEHGDQIGLPGGRREASDPSPFATALREVEEEIGLAPGEVDPLADLGPIDTRTTGFRVHVFVARIKPPARWRLSSEEIVDVLTPTVDELTDPDCRRTALRCFPGWKAPRPVEAVSLPSGHVAWGFTLRLLDLALPRVRFEARNI